MITDKLMDKMQDIYNSGVDLKTWEINNKPDPKYYYASGPSSQIKRITALNDIIRYYEGYQDPRIVGSHKSKSVSLPVTCFELRPYNQVAAYVFIRDNFYDIKVIVVSDSPISIPYDLIHNEWTQEKYDHEKERCAGYPRDDIILKYHGSEALAKKKALLASGDEWYSNDWSGNFIVRKNGRIYQAIGVQRVYCEGIDDLPLPHDAHHVYEDSNNIHFGCSVGSYSRVGVIIEYILNSLEQERFDRLDRNKK